MNDIDTSGDGGGSSIEGNNNSVELEKIKKECASMINQLMELHEEERQLREANTNLSQRALVMGCTAGLDGGTRRDARRKAAAKKAASQTSTPTSQINESTTKMSSNIKPTK